MASRLTHPISPLLFSTPLLSFFPFQATQFMIFRLHQKGSITAIVLLGQRRQFPRDRIENTHQELTSTSCDLGLAFHFTGCYFHCVVPLDTSPSFVSADVTLETGDTGDEPPSSDFKFCAILMYGHVNLASARLSILFGSDV
uniref:Secreted protein n=1 Tax=Echinococcus granulosus TaxID=6210 RepID=A0A068X531_ECHGR|nr:hypothetical protein EgrG_002062400 [Echinococcus granulosus]